MRLPAPHGIMYITKANNRGAATKGATEEGSDVYESNIDWILAIASFLAGIGIGSVGYHLLNANVARNQKVRQRLAETELELNQVRDGLSDHFARTADLINGIQQHHHELRQQLALGAERFCDDTQVKRRLSGEPVNKDAEPGETPEMPRDYADGGRGTLAEDFGLRQENEEERRAQPLRY